MSASSTPTFSPFWAIAAARLTVTLDLPTPPLPEATAKTLVSEPGRAKGMSRTGLSPRSSVCRAWRCSVLITSSSTSTCETPGRAPTAVVTRSVMVSFIGQPLTVRKMPTRATPSGPTSADLTMPSSVTGRRISGSITVESAAVSCSAVGIEAGVAVVNTVLR